MTKIYERTQRELRNTEIFGVRLMFLRGVALPWKIKSKKAERTELTAASISFGVIRPKFS